MSDHSHCPVECENTTLIRWGVSSGEFLMWGFGRSLRTYSGDSEPKEYGGGCHDVVDPSPMIELLPLDIAGSDKQGDEDTCTTI